ncbi:MAG: hypothetical protein HOO00_06510 [Rhodospirillaceae bacterium]|nr:hypothetical protein [Rhodospirillaceae bacterium]MBT5658631.1 hypothetical protein [Rhodospirillaceae bacterium]MBT5751876.1 hypothetical protein [Rhodospirillaceae bacterium]
MSDIGVLPGNVAALDPASLATYLDHIRVGFCLYNPQGQLVICNAPHLGFFKSIEHIFVPGALGQDIHDVILQSGVLRSSIEAQAKFTWIVPKDRCEAKRSFEVELSDGHWIRVDEELTENNFLVETTSDITELKAKEQALEMQVLELLDSEDRLEAQGSRLVELTEIMARSRDEAQKSSKTKSEFLANMSHELRSPLNAIIGFAEIMKDEMFGALGRSEYKEYAVDIHLSGTHLLDVINDILDLSKIEAGKLELVENNVDIWDVVEMAVRLSVPRADKGKITLKNSIPKNLPGLIADERKLKQIFINLVSNAIKFTPEGGEVSVEAEMDSSGSLALSVVDTGIGIAEENIPRAMAPFGQIDASLDRKYEGTGLGLPLTNALVDLHEGTLSIESIVDKGTRVIITLPSSRIVDGSGELLINRG